MPNQPRLEWRSNVTQQIANRLPDHSKIRRKRDSVGQSFLNSTVGIHVHDLLQDIEHSFRSQYARTVPLDLPDVSYELILPTGFNLENPQNTKNFLRNSSFDLRTNPSWFADWWKWNSEGTIAIGEGVRGASGLDLSASLGEETRIYQELPNEWFSNGSAYTLSLWYRIPGEPIAVPTEDFGVVVRGLKKGGGYEVHKASFVGGTSDMWRKLKLSFTWASDIRGIEVWIRNTTTAGYDKTLSLDTVQLEAGLQSTSWQPHIFESYMWEQRTVATPVTIESPIHVQFQDRVDQWWFAYPTRSEFINTEIGGLTVPEAVGITQEVDFWKQIWPARYKIIDNQIRKSGIDPEDVFADYDIQFWTPDRQFDTATYTLEAITFFRNQIYAILTKEDWTGTLRRYLAAIPVKVPHPEPDYLEAIHMVQLPAELDPAVVPTVTRFEFRWENSEVLYVDDGTTEYRVQLHHDYFLMEFTAGIIRFRESYTTPVLTHMTDRKTLR